jgi:hypothetical protein
LPCARLRVCPPVAPIASSKSPATSTRFVNDSKRLQQQVGHRRRRSVGSIPTPASISY